MRISFKETNDGNVNEIFFEDHFVGTVNLDLWSGQWRIAPNFSLAFYTKDSVAKKKYESAYKAGKELVRLYEETMTYELDEPPFEDTQEIDMRDMFKSFRIP